MYLWFFFFSTILSTRNGLFHFLSIQVYGRPNFEKPICPGKNDCLTHKSPGIESLSIWFLRKRWYLKKNYHSPTLTKVTVQIYPLEKYILKWKGSPGFLHPYPCMDKKWNSPIKHSNRIQSNPSGNSSWKGVFRTLLDVHDGAWLRRKSQLSLI